jgi:hypothetical protein
MLVYNKHLLGFAILRYLMIEVKPLPKLCVNELSVLHICALTLNLLTTTIVAPPSNASKWQMGFNSAFKGLNKYLYLCN